MRIAPHSTLLAAPTRVAAPVRGVPAGQASRTLTPFAVLVDNRTAASATTAVADRTCAKPNSGQISTVNVNPLAGLVSVVQAATTGTASSTTTAGTTATSTTASSTSTTTATAGTSAPTTAAVTVQPGISALIAAIMNGSFVPTYKDRSQLVEATPLGNIADSPAYYASDQTAQQLATLLGGTVVQKVPFASSNATTTEPKANFIQLPSGQTVNAADLSYYAQFGGYGQQQLAADLTQEINQGGEITAYNDQMVAFLSGKGSHPGDMPMFQAGVIGPAIAGMTYPAGTLAADGSVINPNAPKVGT